jgi:hypothetical protein
MGFTISLRPLRGIYSYPVSHATQTAEVLMKPKYIN